MFPRTHNYTGFTQNGHKRIKHLNRADRFNGVRRQHDTPVTWGPISLRIWGPFLLGVVFVQRQSEKAALARPGSDLKVTSLQYLIAIEITAITATK